MESMFTPQRATIHFCDGNHVWSETGLLNVRLTGPYGRERLGFVLDVKTSRGEDNGTRVFPLTGRTVEVYLSTVDSDEPAIIRENWELPC